MRTGIIFFLAMSSLCAQRVVKEARFAVDYDQPVRRLAAARPVNAIGLIAAEHSHASLRGSRDGATWGPWQQVVLGHEGGTVVWFEQGVQEVEFQAGSTLRVLFIDPGPSSRQSTSEPIVSRAGWGCGPECNPASPPVYAPVTHLVVHHSAGGNSATDWAAIVRSIWVLHVRGNGWNDIGYNYLIDPNGVTYEGRAGGEGVVGAHFSGVNTGTMGVCLMGTYSTVPPSAAALDSLSRLLGQQAQRWSLDPLGQTLHTASGLTLNVISGHRDAGLSPRASGATECPGNGLYTWLPALRNRIERTRACAPSLERRNYCFGAAGGSFPIAVEVNPGCEIGVSGGAEWVRVRDGRLIADPNPAPARRGTDLRIGGSVIQVAQAEAGVEQLPCVARGGVVNAASFDARPLALGSIASLFGEDLWREGAPPSVTVNGRAATVFGAVPGQLNFALPAGTQTGSARLEVVRQGIRSPETMIWVTEAAPAIFAAQNFDDGSLHSASRPVRPGRPLIIYLTGIGANRALPWEVRIDGAPAEGLFLGPAPGFLGLGQANVAVPTNLSPGEHRLEIIVSGAASPPLPLFTGPLNSN
ncbi:MAG: N-acetylmuramoyl-L-alanine amidase [Acidobacteriota bacterium]